MNGEDALIPFEYAKLSQALSEARKARLEELGHTEKSFREMERNVQVLMIASNTTMIDTEYGVIQLIPDKPIQYTIRRNTEPIDTIFKKRVKFNNKKEK